MTFIVAFLSSIAVGLLVVFLAVVPLPWWSVAGCAIGAGLVTFGAVGMAVSALTK